MTGREGKAIKDYYRILGVSAEATQEVIKAAYRALMKIHHPDVGGNPEVAKAIEEAYRHLSARPGPFVQKPAFTDKLVTLGNKELAPISTGGRNLTITVSKMLANQVFPCPGECVYFRRFCRYKQALSLETKDLQALRASTLLLQVSNNSPHPQQFDCRFGRGVLVDQTGEFYHCHQVCSWLHQPKYKETGVELFPGTHAAIQLWFPQLPPGRWPQRFVYKHRALIREIRGDWLDEELIELSI